MRHKIELIAVMQADMLEAAILKVAILKVAVMQTAILQTTICHVANYRVCGLRRETFCRSALSSTISVVSWPCGVS